MIWDSYRMWKVCARATAAAYTTANQTQMWEKNKLLRPDWSISEIFSSLDSRVEILDQIFWSRLSILARKSEEKPTWCERFCHVNVLLILYELSAKIKDQHVSFQYGEVRAFLEKRI